METRELWTRLERFQNNSEARMTRETYYTMCEQMGKEPDPDEMPPELQDFPPDVQTALVLYNKLGDRIYPDIGYLGKDYTQLPIYMDVYGVENKKIFLETLLLLDSRIIKKSAEALKGERDRIKRAG
jgi:hypothetical protein